MQIRKSATSKYLTAGLAGVYFFTNCALAYAAETNLWSERRSARLNGQAAQAESFDVARLPMSSQPALADLVRTSLPNLSNPNSVPTLERELPFHIKDKNLTSLLRRLPAAYGTVQKIHPVKGAAVNTPVVFHIQDVHLNKEAQANIAKTIESLLVSQATEVVAIEGAFKNINLDAFHQFPHLPSVRHAADYLLRENIIGGPLHTAMSAGALGGALNPALVGVDDKRLFDKNVQAFLNSRAKRDKLKREVAQRVKAVENRLEKNAGADLLLLSRRMSGFARSSSELGAHVAYLSGLVDDRPLAMDVYVEALELEKSLNLAQIEIEKSGLIKELAEKLSQQELSHLFERGVSFRTGTLSHTQFFTHLNELSQKKGINIRGKRAWTEYVQYLKLADKIDVEALLKSVREMEHKAVKILALTREEEQDLELLRENVLVEKLLDFSLTPGEWKEYAALNREREPGALSAPLAPFEDFYRFAEERNESMASNLQRAMAEKKAGVGLLVAGGFHTPGLVEELNKRGFSVVTYTPKITKVDSPSGYDYLTHFAQAKSPLDQIFEGEKLFLATLQGTPAQLGQGAVLSYLGAAEAGTPLNNLRDHARKNLGWEITDAKLQVGPPETELVIRTSQGQPPRVFKVTRNEGNIDGLKTSTLPKNPTGLMGWLWHYPIQWFGVNFTARGLAPFEEILFSYVAFLLLPQLMESWGAPAGLAVFLTYLITNALFALSHPKAYGWFNGQDVTTKDADLTYLQGIKKNFWRFFLMGAGFRVFYLIGLAPFASSLFTTEVPVLTAIIVHALWNNFGARWMRAPVGAVLNVNDIRPRQPNEVELSERGLKSLVESPRSFSQLIQEKAGDPEKATSHETQIGEVTLALRFNRSGRVWTVANNGDLEPLRKVLVWPEAVKEGEIVLSKAGLKDLVVAPELFSQVSQEKAGDPEKAMSLETKIGDVTLTLRINGPKRVWTVANKGDLGSLRKVLVWPEAVKEGEVVLSREGLEELMNAPKVFSRAIQDRVGAPTEAKFLETRIGEVTLTLRFNFTSRVWTVANKGDLGSLRKVLVWPEVVKEGEIVLSTGGLEEFLASPKAFSKVLQERAGNPEDATSLEKQIGMVTLTLRFNFTSRVWTVANKGDLETLRKVLVWPGAVKEGEIVLSPGGLEELMMAPKAFSQAIQDKVGDPTEARSLETKIGEVNLTLRFNGPSRVWTVANKGDLETLRKVLVWPEVVKEGEIVLSKAGLKDLVVAPQLFPQVIQEKAGDPEKATSLETKIGDVTLTLRFNFTSRVWTVANKEDLEKLADQLDRKVNVDIEEIIERLGLEDAIGLLGADSQRLQQYIRIHHPELGLSRVEDIVKGIIKALVIKWESIEELHKDYSVVLPIPTIQAPSGGYATTKENSMKIEGRIQPGIKTIQVVGAYTKEIKVKEDGTFTSILPLPKTGQENIFNFYAVDEDNEEKGELVEITVDQTGQKEDTKAILDKLTGLKTEILEKIQKDPAKYHFLLRSVELALLKKFTYSEEDGLRYLRELIEEEENPSQKAIYKAVLKRFQSIVGEPFELKAGQRLYFFQKYVIRVVQDMKKLDAPGIIIAIEQGMGKTLVALMLINGRGALVISPNSVVSTWLEQEKKFVAEPRMESLEGSYRERDAELKGRHRPQIVTNVEYLRNIKDERVGLLSDETITLVVDEADILGSKSQQALGIRKLKAGFRMLLSATPMKRVSQLAYILGTIFPDEGRYKSAKAFAQAFPASDSDAMNALYVLMQNHMIRIRKRDVFESYDRSRPLDEQSDRLPEKVEVDINEGRFTLTPEQVDSIYELFTNYQGWCEKHKGHESEEDKTFHKYKDGFFSKREALRQIMNDPAYIGRPDMESPKHRKMKEIVKKELGAPGEKERKVLIFCRYRWQVETYLRLFADYGAVAYYGGLKQNANGYKVDENNQLLYYKVDEYGTYVSDENGIPIPSTKLEGKPMRAMDYSRRLFQDHKGTQMLVATYDAGAVGVTLTAADVVIDDDLASTFRDQYQSDDRAHRIDNSRKKYEVKYYRLMAEYPEEHLETYSTENQGKYFSMGTYDQVHFQNLLRQGQIFYRVFDGIGDESELISIHIKFLKERLPFLFGGEERQGEENLDDGRDFVIDGEDENGNEAPAGMIGWLWHYPLQWFGANFTARVLAPFEEILFSYLAFMLLPQLMESWGATPGLAVFFTYLFTNALFALSHPKAYGWFNGQDITTQDADLTYWQGIKKNFWRFFLMGAGFRVFYLIGLAPFASSLLTTEVPVLTAIIVHAFWNNFGSKWLKTVVGFIEGQNDTSQQNRNDWVHEKEIFVTAETDLRPGMLIRHKTLGMGQVIAGSFPKEKKIRVAFQSRKGTYTKKTFLGLVAINHQLIVYDPNQTTPEPEPIKTIPSTKNSAAATTLHIDPMAKNSTQVQESESAYRTLLFHREKTKSFVDECKRNQISEIFNKYSEDIQPLSEVEIIELSQVFSDYPELFYEGRISIEEILSIVRGPTEKLIRQYLATKENEGVENWDELLWVMERFPQYFIIIYLDLDNTSFTSKTYWGSDQWYYDNSQYFADGSWRLDVEKQGTERMLLRKKMMKPTHPNLIPVLKKMKEAHPPLQIILLTTRRELFALNTKRILEFIGMGEYAVRFGLYRSKKSESIFDDYERLWPNSKTDSEPQSGIIIFVDDQIKHWRQKQAIDEIKKKQIFMLSFQGVKRFEFENSFRLFKDTVKHELVDESEPSAEDHLIDTMLLSRLSDDYMRRADTYLDIDVIAFVSQGSNNAKMAYLEALVDFFGRNYERQLPTEARTKILDTFYGMVSYDKSIWIKAHEKGKFRYMKIDRTKEVFRGRGNYQLQISLQNAYFFLEPLLDYLVRSQPEILILPDTGTRPFLQALEYFVQAENLPTKVLMFPVSQADGRDNLYELSRWMKLLRGSLEPNDEEEIQLIEYLRSLQLDKIQSDRRVVVFDDNISTGRTMEFIKKIIEEKFRCHVEGLFVGFDYRSHDSLSFPLHSAFRIFGKYNFRHTMTERAPPVIVLPEWEIDSDIKGFRTRMRFRYPPTEKRGEGKGSELLNHFKIDYKEHFHRPGRHYEWSTLPDQDRIERTVPVQFNRSDSPDLRDQIGHKKGLFMRRNRGALAGWIHDDHAFNNTDYALAQNNNVYAYSVMNGNDEIGLVLLRTVTDVHGELCLVIEKIQPKHEFDYLLDPMAVVDVLRDYLANTNTSIDMLLIQADMRVIKDNSESHRVRRRIESKYFHMPKVIRTWNGLVHESDDEVEHGILNLLWKRLNGQEKERMTIAIKHLKNIDAAIRKNSHGFLLKVFKARLNNLQTKIKYSFPFDDIDILFLEELVNLASASPGAYQFNDPEKADRKLIYLRCFMEHQKQLKLGIRADYESIYLRDRVFFDKEKRLKYVIEYLMNHDWNIGWDLKNVPGKLIIQKLKSWGLGSLVFERWNTKEKFLEYLAPGCYTRRGRFFSLSRPWELSRKNFDVFLRGGWYAAPPGFTYHISGDENTWADAHLPPTHFENRKGFKVEFQESVNYGVVGYEYDNAGAIRGFYHFDNGNVRFMQVIMEIRTSTSQEMQLMFYAEESGKKGPFISGFVVKGNGERQGFTGEDGSGINEFIFKTNHQRGPFNKNTSSSIGMIGFLYHYPIQWFGANFTARVLAPFEEILFSYVAFLLLPQLMEGWGLSSGLAVVLTYLITNALFALFHPKAYGWFNGQDITTKDADLTRWQGIKKNFKWFLLMGAGFRVFYLIGLTPIASSLLTTEYPVLTAIIVHALWNNFGARWTRAPVGAVLNVNDIRPLQPNEVELSERGLKSLVESPRSFSQLIQEKAGDPEKATSHKTQIGEVTLALRFNGSRRVWTVANNRDLEPLMEVLVWPEAVKKGEIVLSALGLKDLVVAPQAFSQVTQDKSGDPVKAKFLETKIGEVTLTLRLNGPRRVWTVANKGDLDELKKVLVMPEGVKDGEVILSGPGLKDLVVAPQIFLQVIQDNSGDPEKAKSLETKIGEVTLTLRFNGPRRVWTVANKGDLDELKKVHVMPEAVKEDEIVLSPKGLKDLVVAPEFFSQVIQQKSGDPEKAKSLETKIGEAPLTLRLNHSSRVWTVANKADLETLGRVLVWPEAVKEDEIILSKEGLKELVVSPKSFSRVIHNKSGDPEKAKSLETTIGEVTLTLRSNGRRVWTVANKGDLETLRRVLVWPEAGKEGEIVLSPKGLKDLVVAPQAFSQVIQEKAGDPEKATSHETQIGEVTLTLQLNDSKRVWAVANKGDLETLRRVLVWPEAVKEGEIVLSKQGLNKLVVATQVFSQFIQEKAGDSKNATSLETKIGEVALTLRFNGSHRVWTVADNRDLETLRRVIVWPDAVQGNEIVLSQKGLKELVVAPDGFSALVNKKAGNPESAGSLEAKIGDVTLTLRYIGKKRVWTVGHMRDLEKLAEQLDKRVHLNLVLKRVKHASKAGMIGWLWHYPIQWFGANFTARVLAPFEEILFSYLAFMLLPQLMESWGAPAGLAVFLTYLTTNALFALSHPKAYGWFNGQDITTKDADLTYLQGIKKNFWRFFLMGMGFRIFYLVGLYPGAETWWTTEYPVLTALLIHAIWNNFGAKWEKAQVGTALGRLTLKSSQDFDSHDRGNSSNVTPPAVVRVGDLIMEAAASLKSGPQDDRGILLDKFARITTLQLGQLFEAPGKEPSSFGLRERQALLAYIQAKVAQKVDRSEISFEEAFQLAATLTRWVGEEVKVDTNKQWKMILQNEDWGNVKRLLLSSALKTTLLVDEKDESFFNAERNTLSDPSRVAVVAVKGLIDTTSSHQPRLNRAALEKQLFSYEDTELENSILSFRSNLLFSDQGQALLPSSPLRFMTYTPLEDVLGLYLPSARPLRSLPMQFLIEMAVLIQA